MTVEMDKEELKPCVASYRCMPACEKEMCGRGCCLTIWPQLDCHCSPMNDIYWTEALR